MLNVDFMTCWDRTDMSYVESKIGRVENVFYVPEMDIVIHSHTKQEDPYISYISNQI